MAQPPRRPSAIFAARGLGIFMMTPRGVEARHHRSVDGEPRNARWERPKVGHGMENGGNPREKCWDGWKMTYIYICVCVCVLM